MPVDLTALVQDKNVQGKNAIGKELLAVAQEAARAAGDELLARYHEPTNVHSKASPDDLVSEADFAAERVIAALLTNSRPDDGMLGEEATNNHAGSSGLHWIVDPLDGTTNYLMHVPLWSVSIACNDQDGPLVGVVYDPLRDEMFAGARDHGATLNDQPLSGSKQTQLAAAALCGDIDCLAPEDAVRVGELAAQLYPLVGKRRALGTAALELAWTADGRFDACYQEKYIQPWDVEAGLLLCEQAGLFVHRLQPFRPGACDRYLAAPPALSDTLFQHILSAQEARPPSWRAPFPQR